LESSHEVEDMEDEVLTEVEFQGDSVFVAHNQLFKLNKTEGVGKSKIDVEMVYPRDHSNSVFSFGMPPGVYYSESSDLKRGLNPVLIGKTKIQEYNRYALNSKGWIVIKTNLRVETLLSDDCRELPYAIDASNLSTNEVFELASFVKAAKTMRVTSDYPYLTSFKIEKNYALRVYGFKVELSFEEIDPIEFDVISFSVNKMLSYKLNKDEVKVTDVFYEMYLTTSF